MHRIRLLVLTAMFGLIVSSTAWSQQKGKPASEELTGVKVGTKAPGFTLTDQEGKERKLEDFLARKARSPWSFIDRPTGDRSAARNWSSCNAT